MRNILNNDISDAILKTEKSTHLSGTAGKQAPRHGSSNRQSQGKTSRSCRQQVRSLLSLFIWLIREIGSKSLFRVFRRFTRSHITTAGAHQFFKSLSPIASPRLSYIPAERQTACATEVLAAPPRQLLISISELVFQSLTAGVAR